MHTFFNRRVMAACVASILLGALGAGASQSDQDRPKLSLKAAPRVGRAPLRVVLTAELTGGADDYFEFYCPSVEWEWGDGTESVATTDCEPYEAGKSAIKRRFTVEHTFKGGGNFTIAFRLKRQEKVLAGTTVQVQVQPGVRDIQ